MRTILLRIFGLIFIIVYIYIRILLERMSISLKIFLLEDDTIIINLGLFLFLNVLLIIASLGLYFNISYFLQRTVKIPKNIITDKIGYLYNMLKDSLIELNIFISENIPNSYGKMKLLTLAFYRKFGHKERLLFTCFNVLPYFTIALAFFVDTFVLFEFKYFYKALPLITIPLFFNIWLRLIEDLKNNIAEIAKNLIIKHRFLEDGQDEFLFKVKPDKGFTPKEIDLILSEDVPEFLTLYPLKGFLESYNKIEKTYKPYLKLIFYSTYFVDVLYILLSNLILLVL